MPLTVPYVFQAGDQLFSFATVAAGGFLTAPLFTIWASRPGCGMIARFGALPPLTLTGRSDSKVFEPVYWILIPVHFENSAHELFSESDSGLRIDPNIVTVLPLWPA